MKVICIIDMQNDFITGSLGTPEAVVARDNLCEWAKKSITSDDKVIFTRDTHGENYLDTQEGKNLPVPHCIKDTEGWDIDKKVVDTIFDIEPYISLVDKPTFGSMNLKNNIPFDMKQVDEIIFCGVCTDICVVSNALITKANFPEIKMSVIADCCAGVTPEKHNAALEVMRSCQIDVIGG